MNAGHVAFILRWAAVGLAVGHVARRVSPWLIGLRDRRLPFRWPWPELLGAAGFSAAAIPVGFSGTAPAVRFVLVGLLLALTVTDIHRKVLPNVLTLGGTSVGLLMTAWRPEPIESFLSQWLSLHYVHLPAAAPDWCRGLVLATIGATFGFVLLEGFRRLLAAMTGVDGLGGGDPKLLAMIGAFLGPHAVILTLLPACAIGAAAGVLERLRTGLPHTAFGPALAAGGVAVMLAGEAFLDLLWRLSLGLVSMPTGVVFSFYAVLLALLVVVVLRLRSRAASYNEILDHDYEALEAEIGVSQDDSAAPGTAAPGTASPSTAAPGTAAPNEIDNG